MSKAMESILDRFEEVVERGVRLDDLNGELEDRASAAERKVFMLENELREGRDVLRRIQPQLEGLAQLETFLRREIRRIGDGLGEMPAPQQAIAVIRQLRRQLNETAASALGIDIGEPDYQSQPHAQQDKFDQKTAAPEDNGASAPPDDEPEFCFGVGASE